MNQQQQKPTIRIPTKTIFKGIAWIIVVAGLIYAVLDLFASPMAVWVAVAVALVGLVAMLLVLAFVMGGAWTGLAMERGARIALEAQVSDDKRDIAQMTAFREIFKQVMQFKGALPAANDVPQLSDGGRPIVEDPALQFSPDDFMIEDGEILQ